MKLRNYVMSRVLSPGAFAIWHSLGNPEEWENGRDSLYHKNSRVSLCVPDVRGEGAPPFVLSHILICFIGGFIFDCEGEHEGAVGLIERHLVAPRAYRAARIIRRKPEAKKRRERNRKVFSLLTINQ